MTNLSQPGESFPRIVFLEVPESLGGRIGGIAGEDFAINPGVPLPVELPPGEERLDLERLSWEMILSGMIRLLAEDPGRIHGEYYRRFVLAARPEILQDLTGAAMVKAEKGDYGMALEILQNLEGLFPGSPELLMSRALALEQQSEERAEALERSGREAEAELLHQKAREAWERALEPRPGLPEAWFNAGFFFMRLRDFSRARECFSVYLSQEEGEGEKRERAGAALREIEREGLDDEALREAYGLIRGGKEEEGLLWVRDFLERRPEVWNGWFVLGWALRRLGRWADGAVSFRQALKQGGDTPDTRNELAICLSELGDLKAARRELEAALREEPENIKTISNLGALALKSGQREEAEGFFRAVLELDPEDPLARELLNPRREKR